MQTFVNTAAQGEITIRKIEALPNGEALQLENGQLIIGHSETGHHHVLERVEGATITVAKDAPAGMRILYALLEQPNRLVHMRGHDTHETIELPAGMYEFRSGREFDPYEKLARRVAD